MYDTIPYWLGLSVWALTVLVMISLLRRRFRKRRLKREAELRPRYEFGNSISEWELACQQSLKWSLDRRHEQKEDKV